MNDRINLSERPSVFWKFLRLFLRHWKLIIFSNVLVGILALIIALNLKLSYRSSAVVVVQSEEIGSGITAMLAQASPINLGFSGGTDVAKYMGYLESERIVDSIIVHFDLQERYEKETLFHTRQKVLEDMAVVDREDGTFAISYVVEEDPDLAAAVVNKLYEELYEIALEVSQARASDYRSYLEASYATAGGKLESMIAAFQAYQEETGVLALEDQVRLSLEGLAQIEAERIGAKVELDFLRRSMSGDNSRIQVAEQRIAALEREIRNYKERGSYSNLPIKEIPSSSAQYLTQFRDIEVQTKVVEFLVLQLEQAKLEERKQTADLYLLYPASPTDYKYKPKRLNILVGIVFFYNLFLLGTLQARELFTRNREEILTFIRS